VTSVLLLMKISWRNLWRNPRGTLLTALALGLGLALLLVSLGLLDGGHEQMVADGVRLGTGHVVIQSKGFQDTGSQELLLPASAVLMTDNLLHSAAMRPLVRGVSPRLVATGLLSSAANTAGVRIIGVIPRQERTVSLMSVSGCSGSRGVDGWALSWRSTSAPCSRWPMRAPCVTMTTCRGRCACTRDAFRPNGRTTTAT